MIETLDSILVGRREERTLKLSRARTSVWFRGNFSVSVISRERYYWFWGGIKRPQRILYKYTQWCHSQLLARTTEVGRHLGLEFPEGSRAHHERMMQSRYICATDRNSKYLCTDQPTGDKDVISYNWGRRGSPSFFDHNPDHFNSQNLSAKRHVGLDIYLKIEGNGENPCKASQDGIGDSAEEWDEIGGRVQKGFTPSRSFSLGFQSMSDPASIERANAFLFGSTKDVGVGGR